MERILTIVALVASLLLLGGAEADAAASHAANGRYEAIDVVDGSDLRVNIRNNRVDFRDDGATVCEENGFGFVRARHRGRPVVVDADTVSVTADLECKAKKGGWTTVLADFTLTYTWDADAGLLTDSTGQTYTRS